MTIVEKADKKSFDYNTKYSEDGTLKSMLAEPHRFVEGAIEGIIDLLRKKAYRDGYIAGAKENGIVWHKVADEDLPKGEEYGNKGIHRYIYLKDRYGKLYTGNYYPKDKNHEEDCFAVEFLEWGFQGSNFCKKEQISEWCEIPQ